MSFTLQNVRLGFATNSSSSHSIVFANDTGLPLPKESLVNSKYRWKPDDFQFGWELFELDSPNTKLAYLAIIVAASLSHTPLSTSMADMVLREFFAGTGIENAIPMVHQGYINHQSMFNIPYNNLAVLGQRVREYIEVFTDPRITIYGGNDNDDSRHEETDTEQHLGFWGYYSSRNNGIRCRKDGDAIILFNETTGAKLRYSSASTPYTKAIIPELVDLKITDYCPYNCEFCYQASTRAGRAAPLWYIEEILSALGTLGTFEIAIGGGEPTTHPQFARILSETRNVGIVPNFTTFAVDWLLDQEIVESVEAHCGGIGVSVHTSRDYAKLAKIKGRLPNKRIVAQHVFGSQPMGDLQRIMWNAKCDGIPVLLLGLKTTGRGKDFAPVDMTSDCYWLKHLPELSVDTAFVERHQNILDLIGADKVLISAKEGAFSMYIDAVEERMGPSSYCDASEMVPVAEKRRLNDAEPTADEIKKAFAKF
jgi:hypothetical protein